jgi:hypothetical protein
MWSKLFLVLAFVPALVFGVAPTDELQDAVCAIHVLLREPGLKGGI